MNRYHFSRFSVLILAAHLVYVYPQIPIAFTRLRHHQQPQKCANQSSFMLLHLFFFSMPFIFLLIHTLKNIYTFIEQLMCNVVVLLSHFINLKGAAILVCSSTDGISQHNNASYVNLMDDPSLTHLSHLQEYPENFLNPRSLITVG